MSDELHKPGDWMKTLRRIRFDQARDGVRGATIKAVGTMLASYADYRDGTGIRPGTARVAIDCEIDYRTAKRCIAALRDLGLIKLVRKAERRGQADVYRLDIPEDLLDRDELDVWDPDRYELEIGRLREKHRGTYTPKSRRVENLRGTEGTAETGPAESVPDTSAGHGGDRRTESAGHAGPNLRGTPCPPTYQSTYQGLVPSSEDLTEEVAVSRARSHDTSAAPTDLASRDRCPHGRSTRRNKDGRLRCTECRATEESPPHSAECGHGVNSRYRCPACARGLPGDVS